jgi:hypothetical protein
LADWVRVYLTAAHLLIGRRWRRSIANGRWVDGYVRFLAAGYQQDDQRRD